MQVVKKHFDNTLPDNEEQYFGLIIGVIEAVDELCSLQITKINDKYHFRVAPSVPMYNELLLQEITKFHNMFNIHLDLGKSIKTSGSLDFSINLN